MVACLVAGTSRALLNSDKVDAYYKSLAERMHRDQHDDHTLSLQQTKDYHPGLVVTEDPTGDYEVIAQGTSLQPS